MFTCVGLLDDFNDDYNSTATPSSGKNYLRRQGEGCSRRLDLPGGGGGEELKEVNALPTRQVAQSMVCEAPRPGKVPSVISECHKVRFVLEDIRQTTIKGLHGKKL